MNSSERASMLGVLFLVTLFCGFWVFMVFLIGWTALWGLVGLAALVVAVSLLAKWVDRGDELHPDTVVSHSLDDETVYRIVAL